MEKPKHINHTNTSLENLNSHIGELRTKRDELLEPYNEVVFKSRYGTPEERVECEEQKRQILETLSNNKELIDIEEKIFEMNKEIIMRHRKDLATNYLVTQMVINDLYERMLELPEDDSRLEEIESRIFEIEELLQKDAKAMGEEGLSPKRVESGLY